ncbi:unnamed protein product [Periconia digitata]|uniref:DUF7708 domain-containing protein n=1 Tax=Periconia digitata TaxID=1303443 RepID=A0A9W4UGS4_9PLEO|nr:unnamed protein product [Periconia digitata]
MAQAKYESTRTGSKVRDRLAAVSSRVLYYGHVLDVISQHHPEFVSLAWGTLKFLFVLVLNHEETTSELAKAVANIGDVLPRAKLQLEIFSADSMRGAVEILYTDILTFLSVTLEWYQQGSLMRAWRAFTQPYKLRLKVLRDKIDESVRRVDNMAHTLSHHTINKMYDLILKLNTNFNENHLVYLSRFSGLDRGQNQIQTDLILKATKDTGLQDPVETLRFCRSIRHKRMHRYDIDKAGILPALDSWSNTLRSSLIVLGGSGSTRFQTKDLATEMVDLLRDVKKNVLWVLKGRNRDVPEDSIHTVILKQLVHQSVQLNHHQVAHHISANFNAPRISAASSKNDWLGILSETLIGLSEVYLIIDMEALGYRTNDEAAFWLEFFGLIQQFVQNAPEVAIKVAIFTFRQGFIQSVESNPNRPLVVPLPRKTGPVTSKVQKRQSWNKKKRNILRLRHA